MVRNTVLSVILMSALTSASCQSLDSLKTLLTSSGPDKSAVLRELGSQYYDSRKIDSSIYYYREALTATPPEDSLTIADIHLDLGLSFYSGNDLKRAMESYMIALPIFEKSGDQSRQINLNTRISFILIQQEQFDRALAYLFSNYKKLRNQDLSPETVKCAFNIANTLKRAGKLEEALLYADSTELFSGELEFEFGRAKALGMKCYILMELKRYDKALAAINAAESIYQEMEADVDIFQMALARARLYQEKQDFKSMLTSVESARKLIGTIEDAELLTEFYDSDYVAQKNNGNFQKALSAHEKDRQLRDSIFKVSNAEKINELLTKYETEKKDQEIKSLAQQSQIQALLISQRNNQLVFGGLATLLLFIVIGVIVQQRRLKHRQAVSDLEQRMLRLQMNPHFIFNALGSIQRYILEKNSADSVDYLAKFAKLMRQILEQSRQESIRVEDEVEMLTNYLEIQQLCYDHKFSFSIEVDDNLDPLTRIPPLFTQPLVENAIEHGVRGVAKGKIHVRFIQDSHAVRIEVEDNGKGLSTASQKDGHQSLATAITQDRLGLLGKKFNRRFSFTIGNTSGVSGTLAQIEVPELG